MTVAIRRCPSPCRWRTASLAPATLSRGDVTHPLPGDVEVDRDGRDLALEQPGELRLTPVDTHQEQAVDTR